MNIRLSNPNHERFVTQQVQSGQFNSAEAVIEDALERMMTEPLTDEDIAAINESEAEIDRGECVDVREYAAQFRRKHGLKS